MGSTLPEPRKLSTECTQNVIFESSFWAFIKSIQGNCPETSELSPNGLNSVQTARRHEEKRKLFRKIFFVSIYPWPEESRQKTSRTSNHTHVLRFVAGWSVVPHLSRWEDNGASKSSPNTWAKLPRKDFIEPVDISVKITKTGHSTGNRCSFFVVVYTQSIQKAREWCCCAAERRLSCAAAPLRSQRWLEYLVERENIDRSSSTLLSYSSHVYRTYKINCSG